MIGYCLSGLLLHAALANSASSIVLVHDGKPKAVIVAPREVHGDLAAAVNDLQAYIQKISGARLSIETEPVAGRGAIVLRWGVEGLSKVGYRLRTQNNDLFIEGATEAGLVNGIYGFLEEHLGVRWYIPGPLGEYVPKRRRILLSAIEETREPAIPSVTGFGGYQADPPKGVEWRRRNRLAGFQPYWHSHNWEGIIPICEVHSHPEWFALIEGERKWQLCTTHPDVLRIAIQRVLEYFQKNPQAKTFSLSPNDFGKFCQCERCRALDRALGVDPFAAEGQFTDRLVHFFNQIAEEVAKHYPDRLLCFYAYLTHTNPPQKVKPHPNLMPVICHTPWEFCHAHPITAECVPCKRFRQIVQGWRALCEHVGIYDYYGHWQWFGQWPLVHTLKVDIPFYAKVGIEHLNSETHDDWWTQPLNILAAVKLAWNPQTDTEALIRDFCRHLFAESSGPVYRYFTMYENLMASMPLDAKNHEDWWIYPSADVVEKGRELLEEALQKARSELVRQRVRRLQIGHRIYTLQWQVATARRAHRVGRAWEAERQFALAVQELHVSGPRDVIDMGLAQQEAQQHGSEAQAYMELLTAAGYTTLEAREQALREAETHGTDFARKLGFLTEWQVIGPFPCGPGKLSHPDIPVDVVHPSQRITTPLGEVGWRKVSIAHPFGLLNLRPLLPKGAWVSAYAVCWVKLPGAISLRLGSNDGAAVWLDGKLLLVSEVPRGFQVDQDRVSVIGDDERWHLLVVKVVDYGGSHWNLAVRFADAGGKPLLVLHSAVPPDAR